MSINMHHIPALAPTTRSGYTLGMGNRIKELRQARNISAEKLALRLGSGRSTIVKLERGEMRLTQHWMNRIANDLGIAPVDLLDDGDGLTVPVVLCVASAFSDGCPGTFDLPTPQRRIQSPPKLENAAECFAAELADDSADRLYPEGSTLIVRTTAALAGEFAVGNKVLVRRFAGDHAGGDTTEVLVGILDRTYSGEIVVLMRTNNRELPSSVIVQHAPPLAAGLSERFAEVTAEATADIDYKPRPDDPAVIEGIVVYAITPE